MSPRFIAPSFTMVDLLVKLPFQCVWFSHSEARIWKPHTDLHADSSHCLRIQSLWIFYSKLIESQRMHIHGSRSGSPAKPLPLRLLQPPWSCYLLLQDMLHTPPWSFSYAGPNVPTGYVWCVFILGYSFALLIFTVCMVFLLFDIRCTLFWKLKLKKGHAFLIT